jgi:hypothetical protein
LRCPLSPPPAADAALRRRRMFRFSPAFDISWLSRFRRYDVIFHFHFDFFFPSLFSMILLSFAI